MLSESNAAPPYRAVGISERRTVIFSLKMCCFFDYRNDARPLASLTKMYVLGNNKNPIFAILHSLVYSEIENRVVLGLFHTFELEL